MYDNIASLRFQKGPNNETLATAMISAEGEVMEFRTNVAAEGRVEDWMTDVLAEMRSSNRLITKEAVFYYCDQDQVRACCAWWCGHVEGWRGKAALMLHAVTRH